MKYISRIYQVFVGLVGKFMAIFSIYFHLMAWYIGFTLSLDYLLLVLTCVVLTFDLIILVLAYFNFLIEISETFGILVSVALIYMNLVMLTSFVHDLTKYIFFSKDNYINMFIFTKVSTVLRYLRLF